MGQRGDWLRRFAPLTAEASFEVAGTPLGGLGDVDMMKQRNSEAQKRWQRQHQSLQN